MRFMAVRPGLPHMGERGLVMTGVPRDIAQRRGKAVAGMLRGRQPRREHETGRLSAPRAGFAAKTVLDGIVRVQEPKHGTWNRGQETHPNAEKLRRDLVGVGGRKTHPARVGAMSEISLLVSLGR